MTRVLIISSYVAASRVGGGAQALALARLGIEPVLVPTVILGRHPGHGPPGGAAVEPATFEAVLGGVEASGAFAGLDAVITGHFSSAQQVAVTAEALERVRATSPEALVVVDPVMGDEGTGLYVREPVAEAIAAELVPMADVVAPNAWELARLSRRGVAGPAEAVAAGRALGRPVLVSSVTAGDDIGIVYVGADIAWLASHPRAATAPKGTGDLLTAAFTAAAIQRRSPPRSLELAAGVVAEAVARAGGAPELPIAALPTRLRRSPRVSLERIGG
jgi:pyridoxine kinase